MKKTEKWEFDICLIHGMAKNNKAIGFIPNIEYIENSFNIGIRLSFLGCGVFIGYFNTVEEKLSEK